MSKGDDFIRLAINDIKVSRLVLSSANDELMQNSAAYHAEQAVEKGLKALKVKAGYPAGISHNINELCKDLDECGVEYPEWIVENESTITSWATTIRYNANFKADNEEIAMVINNTEAWLASIK